VLGNRPEVTSLYLHRGLARDMTKELVAVKAPITFFAADPWSWSVVLNREGIAHIAKARPDIEVKVFRGSGHAIHARPEYVPALREFLKRSSN